MSATAADIETLEYALDCVQCYCGNFKRMGKPFCFQCFDRLPTTWKVIMATRALKHLESEQAKHYQAAYEYLIKTK